MRLTPSARRGVHALDQRDALVVVARRTAARCRACSVGDELDAIVGVLARRMERRASRTASAGEPARSAGKTASASISAALAGSSRSQRVAAAVSQSRARAALPLRAAIRPRACSQLDPQRRRARVLQPGTEMVERRVQMTGEVTAPRGIEQSLRAPVGIRGQPRRLLECLCRRRVRPCAAGACGHARESLRDRVVGPAGGVGLMPQALLALDRVGQRRVREPAIGGSTPSRRRRCAPARGRTSRASRPAR